jgi:hypothetical protein
MNAIATPATVPQHLRALENANKVRLARADLKRRVGHGHISAAEVIEENPWEARTMTLAELLVSQRRWGGTRSHKFLASLKLSENKPVGKLTDRQRHELSDLLRSGAKRPPPERLGVLQLV